MPRERFNELADEISGVHGVFQRLNPYDPIEGEEEPFFGIEKISYGLGTKTLKPTYILSIAAKRYGIANIVRADGSDYADAAEAARDKAAHVILRKATGRRWLDINDLMLLRHEEFRREHRYELPGIIEALEIVAGVQAHRARKAAEKRTIRAQRKARKAAVGVTRAPQGPGQAAQHVLNSRAAMKMLITWLSAKATKVFARVDETTDFSDPQNAFAAILIVGDDLAETLVYAACDIMNDETAQKEVASTLRRSPNPIADDAARKFWKRVDVRLDRETARRRRYAENNRRVRSGSLTVAWLTA